jgi:hypothetical protein
MMINDFYNKMIFMLSLILGLILLDMFVPVEFYNNFIDHTRVFRYMTFMITLASLIGTIVVKLEKRKEY